MTYDKPDFFYIKALVLSVENIPLPDGDAGKREAQAHEAVPHQSVGNSPQESAHPC